MEGREKEEKKRNTSSLVPFTKEGFFLTICFTCGRSPSPQARIYKSLCLVFGFSEREHQQKKKEEKERKKNNHTQPHHNHTQPHTTTHNHTQPHTTTHNHTQPHTTTHNHTQPHTTTHNHTPRRLALVFLVLKPLTIHFPSSYKEGVRRGIRESR